MTVKHISGLDLGQSSDYTALVTLEYDVEEIPQQVVVTSGPMGRTQVTTTGGIPTPLLKLMAPPIPKVYRLRRLERFVLGTAYTTIVDRVTGLFERPPLYGSTLVIDKTGVGAAVYDMFARPTQTKHEEYEGFTQTTRIKAAVRPVTITGGSGATPDGAGFRVSKKELVSILQVLLQSEDPLNPEKRRLQLARSIPLVKVLVQELEVFKVKITEAGNETFEAWRTRDHDDCVLALAVALWVAERGRQELWIR